MELSTIDFLQGIFGLIFVIISLFIGLLILSKYFKYHRKELILVGFSWMGMSIPWLGDTVNFIVILTMGEAISPQFSFLISFAALPVVVLCWLAAFSELTSNKHKSLILTIYGIIGAVFEVIFLYFLFTDVTLLGTYSGPFQVEFTPFLQIYLLFNILIVLVTGFMFSRESLMSSNLEIKLKGKFLLLAFISFIIGALLETVIPFTAISVVITRVILTLSALLFYLGFILPDFVKEKFLK